MKIGIAGNFEAMTTVQKDTLLKLLRRFEHSYRDLFVHTGGCIGAEKDLVDLLVMHEIVRELHVHPPENVKIRAKISPDALKKSGIKLIKHSERPHQERNHEIVNSTDIFIAIPKEKEEIKESDVWMAVRYCKRNKKQVITIFPDGKATRWPNKTQSGPRM